MAEANITVIIKRNYEEVSAEAFRYMKEIVENKKDAILGLATGSTPIGLYKKMIEDHKNNGTSYKDIKTVNLDEYVGLGAESDQSYVYFMHDNLFDHIDINESNLCDEGALISDYTWDQVHIKAQYYPVWKDYLLQHAIIINNKTTISSQSDKKDPPRGLRIENE